MSENNASTHVFYIFVHFLPLPLKQQRQMIKL